jgi:uncharacterized protein (TIGR03067 family)
MAKGAVAHRAFDAWTKAAASDASILRACSARDSRSSLSVSERVTHAIGFYPRRPRIATDGDSMETLPKTASRIHLRHSFCVAIAVGYDGKTTAAANFAVRHGIFPERLAVKRYAAIVLAFCLCGIGCGGSKAGPELKQAAAKSDLDQIQGAWKIMADSDNGKSTPAEIAQQGKIVVAGEEFAMYENATSSPQKWRFHLDPTKNPKQIDFTVRGKPALGIYELDGDHWKVAMIQPDSPRPTDFNPANRTMVLDLRRGEPSTSATPPADKPTK